MTNIRIVKYTQEKLITIDSEIIQNPILSLEGKGYYGMLEASAIELEEVPEKIIKELIAVGYIYEVEL